MKNKYLVAILAFVLVFAGGTAYLAYAQGNIPFEGANYEGMRQYMNQGNIDYDQMYQYMNQGNIDYDQMYQFMNDGNWEAMQEVMNGQNINFEQMLPYMQTGRPDLDTAELNELYENCYRNN